jgi:hypothetical protein
MKPIYQPVARIEVNRQLASAEAERIQLQALVQKMERKSL